MQKLDGIVAFIGDSIVLESELNAFILLKTGGVVDSSGDSLSRTILRQQALDELIDGKVLLVHAVKDTNIVITENEIDAEMNNRIQMILHQNGISLDAFESILQNQQGISLSKFKTEVRKQIRQELLKRKVQQQYVSVGSINRRDVDAFYSQYKDSLPPAGKSVLLSMISIRVSAPDKIRQEAYAKIKAIKERLDNGVAFSDAAKLYSDEPNAALGGDLGFISKGTLNELAFEEKAFSMAPGEISDIFETRLGFHIITVVAKRDKMVHVKQVFIPVSPPEDLFTHARRVLDSVRTDAKDKKDFTRAVKLFSTDEISKSRDGLIGWQEISALNPRVLEAVDSLSAGDISVVVQQDNTLSIYRLEDRKDFRPLSLEEDWAEISAIAQQIYSQKKLIDLVKKWRQKTFVDIRL